MSRNADNMPSTSWQSLGGCCGRTSVGSPHLCVPDESPQVDWDVDAAVAVCEHLHAHHIEVVTQLLVLLLKDVAAGQASQAGQAVKQDRRVKQDRQDRQVTLSIGASGRTMLCAYINMTTNMATC